MRPSLLDVSWSIVVHRRFEPTRTAAPIVVGQLLPLLTEALTAGGRVAQLSLDPALLRDTTLGEVASVGSILPGHLVSALITAVLPNGLNVKVCAFFDGTLDLAHLGVSAAELGAKYKVGRKVRSTCDLKHGCPI